MSLPPTTPQIALVFLFVAGLLIASPCVAQDVASATCADPDVIKVLIETLDTQPTNPDRIGQGYVSGDTAIGHTSVGGRDMGNHSFECIAQAYGKVRFKTFKTDKLPDGSQGWVPAYADNGFGTYRADVRYSVVFYGDKFELKILETQPATQ